ncbi:Late-stage biofilm-induced protein [Candida albicans P78042]|nr:hypothetical protein MEO_01421 [Candida albicans P94015]KHC82374.1 Late-stage biofilm-induced protein [Candida albicans P78042]RLP62720.1 hypothetical protein L150_01421 [Candida albicans Ca529L]
MKRTKAKFFFFVAIFTFSSKFKLSKNFSSLLIFFFYINSTFILF